MKRRSPTWFFFALLTGVFAMSLLAPLAWNRAQPVAVCPNSHLGGEAPTDPSCETI